MRGGLTHRVRISRRASRQPTAFRCGCRPRNGYLPAIVRHPPVVAGWCLPKRNPNRSHPWFRNPREQADARRPRDCGRRSPCHGCSGIYAGQTLPGLANIDIETEACPTSVWNQIVSRRSPTNVTTEGKLVLRQQPETPRGAVLGNCSWARCAERISVGACRPRNLL
jgi:hypothetical protein